MSMPPPREPQNTPGNRRRRPDPVPGGWLWLVLLLMLVFVLYYALGLGSPGDIDYSTEFFGILVKNNLVKKVVFVGDSRLSGELKADAAQSGKIDEPLLKKIRQNRFTTLIPESEVKSGAVSKKLD